MKEEGKEGGKKKRRKNCELNKEKFEFIFIHFYSFLFIFIHFYSFLFIFIHFFREDEEGKPIVSHIKELPEVDEEKELLKKEVIEALDDLTTVLLSLR